MKKQILIGAIVFLFAATLGYAQEPDIQGTASLTFTGKYVWRGFDVYGDKSAVHPMVDLFMPDYGVGFSAEGHRANSSGHELTERWDYSLYCLGKMFEGEAHEMNFRLAYVYYNYPDLSSHTTASLDLQEGHVVMSFPRLLGVDGLVPTYILVKLMPVNSGTIVGANSPFGGTSSGWAQIFMLDYALPVTCPLTGLERDLNLHSEFVFNDGVSPVGTNVDHDWSNAVFGVSTNYEIEENVFFTPGIYYQATFDDTVNNDKDETWLSLGLSFKF